MPRDWLRCFVAKTLGCIPSTTTAFTIRFAIVPCVLVSTSRRVRVCFGLVDGLVDVEECLHTKVVSVFFLHHQNVPEKQWMALVMLGMTLCQTYLSGLKLRTSYLSVG